VFKKWANVTDQIDDVEVEDASKRAPDFSGLFPSTPAFIAAAAFINGLPDYRLQPR